MQLLTQNAKLKATSKAIGKKVLNFGIPAYKTSSGKLTCPMAKECIKFCYAQKGAYNWGNVKPVYEWRYNTSKKDNFVQIMNDEIAKKKPHYIRVHDSGDYYSKAYLNKWLEIAQLNPAVKFYSYTNMIQLIKDINIPDNFDFIFSDSGKQKHLIDKLSDRHTAIFKDSNSLLNAGYIDASKNDILATKWHNNNNKIGLIFH